MNISLRFVRRTRKAMAVAFSVIGLYLVAHQVHLTPLVIDLADNTDSNFQGSIGDSVDPLSRFDFSTGEWVAYLKYSIDDVTSTSRLLDGRVFRTNDIKLIRLMKSALWTEYSGADIATASSRLFLYRDDELMFACNVVADHQICGLQGRGLGWIGSAKLEGIFKRFKKVNSPIILFR